MHGRWSARIVIVGSRFSTFRVSIQYVIVLWMPASHRMLLNYYMTASWISQEYPRAEVPQTSALSKATPRHLAECSESCSPEGAAEEKPRSRSGSPIRSICRA